VLFVSHDRAFVSALATRVVEVQAGGVHDFPGNYADYLARAGDDHLSADAVVLRAKQERAAAAVSVERAPTWEENKRRANRRKQLPGLRDRALEAITTAEARKAEIGASFCEPGFFERTPRETVAALEAEERALGPRIHELMAEWEALEEELAADAG